MAETEASNGHGQYTEAYVGILNTYNEQIKESIKKKNDLKEQFFRTIKYIMYALVAALIIVIIGTIIIFVMMAKNKYSNTQLVIGAITSVISSYITVVVSIFKLPKIIADYLFNKEEDKQMNEVIKNIQAYEIQAVKLDNTAKINAEREKSAAKKNDKAIDMSPNVTGMVPTNVPTEQENESAAK